MQLEDGIRGELSMSERARVAYADGKTVELRRDDDAWRLETGLVSRTVAHSPLDAIDIFADGIDLSIGTVVAVQIQDTPMEAPVVDMVVVRRDKDGYGMQFVV